MTTAFICVILPGVFALCACAERKSSVHSGLYSNVKGATLLIHDFARRVDLSIDTIRFYEKQGLLDGEHFSRRANNYRVYSEAAIGRVRLVRQAQAAGFTLREIGSLIQAWENDQLTLDQKELLFRRKIGEIEQRIADLLECKAYLEAKLALARGTSQADLGQHERWQRKRRE
jgi:MerR family copper efflux transcriptional regulator